MSNRVEISMRGSLFSHILLHCELHTPAHDYLSVGLKTNDDTVIRQVITLGSKIGLNLRKSIVSSNSTTLYSIDVSRIEKFSNLLLENLLINHEDRYLLRKLVLKVDKTFKERAFITESLSVAQMLKKYGLKRFPTSIEDLAAAQADESGGVITDLRLLRKLIDGELYPNMTPIEQLYCAIEDEECDEIARILTTSLDVNTPIGRDNPLRLASIQGKVESVKTLLNLGANVNHEFEDGNSCLHSAAWKNSLPVVQLLLEHGATFSANKEGRTHLHQLFCFNHHGVATKEEMIEMTKLLMRSGSLTLSDLDSLTDHEGYNCYRIASANHHHTGVEALLAVGAKPLLKHFFW